MAQTYLNKKQEQFAQFLARGDSQLDAYTNAGYEPSSANASTLANKPIVKARVEEIKAQLEKQHLEFENLRRAAAGEPVKIIEAAEWTFQRVMDMMAENVKLAQVAGEFKAANEGLKMMGEAMNMFEKAARAKSESEKPSQINLIGKVVSALGDLSTNDEVEPVNSLAPRR